MSFLPVFFSFGDISHSPGNYGSRAYNHLPARAGISCYSYMGGSGNLVDLQFRLAYSVFIFGSLWNGIDFAIFIAIFINMVDFEHIKYDS